MTPLFLHQKIREWQKEIIRKFTGNHLDGKNNAKKYRDAQRDVDSLNRNFFFQTKTL